MKEELYKHIVAYKQTGRLPDAFASSKSNFLKLCANYTVNSKSVLLREGKIQVKISERWKVFVECHDLKTHSGRDATWAKINSRYYWHGGENMLEKKYMTAYLVFIWFSKFVLIFSGNMQQQVEH